MAEIPCSIRDLHVNIVGNTGVGKSTLISWWVYNDILSETGGVCVIDPKGSLVERILRYIPDDRLNDCIWVDIDDPLPLDFMSCAPGKEDDVVADLKFMLMGAMAEMAQYPNINKNIENLLYTLIDANRHPDLNKEETRHLRCTFLDVAEFLEDKPRRDFILRHVRNQKLKRGWDKLPSDADRDKILSRINPFVRSETLSKIFGDPKPRLNLDEVIEKKKILLVRVPVVNRSSAAYGKFLIAKIQHAAFSRPEPSDRDRTPLFLYIDEFQNFQASEDFPRMLDMGREYKLCLCLSVTRLEPLTAGMKSALKIIGTYVVFQLNSEDAAYYKPIIEKEDRGKHLREKSESLYLDWSIAPPGDANDKLFHKWAALNQIVAKLPHPLPTIQDAINLGRYEAIYKVGSAPAVIEPTPTPGSKYPTKDQIQRIEYIKERSRKNYGIQSTPAEIGQIRTMDKRACNSPQVRHSEDNDQDPQPGGAPTPPDLR
jgi:hypothetical protein